MPVNLSKSRNISKFHHQKELKSIVNNKKIRSHWNKAINEFNILPKKLTPFTIVKHILKALFWATVYLTFSYMTIILTFDLLQQYHGDEVTTNMQATINNEVALLPNMTVCLKMNTSELFSIHSTSSFDYMSAWSQFFEETTREGIFKVNESQVYDVEIYLSLLKYLAMIYEAERAWESGLTQIFTFNTDESDDWIALKKVLVPNIERYNITLDQLKSVFDGKLCSLSISDWFNYLLDIFYQSSNVRECIAGSKISFVGRDTICFRFIGYQYSLGPLGTTEVITLNLYDDGTLYQKWCQEYSIDLGSGSRSTPRRATTRNETNSYYYNSFPGDTIVYMDIGIKALYRKLPYVNGNIQCSSDTTREECENKCLSGWIRANCHCSAVTFNLTEDTFSYRNCTVDDYLICLKKYAENATNLCTNKCVPLCEQWHYEYNLESLKSYGYSYVNVKTNTYNYVIIEQVFSWPSFAEFIGAFGGALGIWLGLDFMIIIEFIVKLVTWFIKKVLLRNVHDSEEDGHPKNASVKNGENSDENEISSEEKIRNRVVGNQKKYKEDKCEIGGPSIREINESEKQRISRKKRESDTLKEKHVQQRIKHSNNNKAHCSILDDKTKNTNVYGKRPRNQKVNITNSVDRVQCESVAQANNLSARSWFLRKYIVLFIDGEASIDKPAMFLRLVEKLCWAIVYLVGSVFTTLWCVQLVMLYLKDEAVYYPSLIINRTVSFPPPSLCINHYKKRFFEGQDNISDALADYFGRPDIDRASFIQISDDKNWSEPLVSIGLLYFRILAVSEINSYDASFISEYESQLLDSAGDDTLLRDDIDKAINDILVPKLLEWNVTANELRQKLGAELARMIKLKISFTNSNGTIDIVNETSPYTAAITDKLFCYGLSYAINFTDPDDILEFSIDKTSHGKFLESGRNSIIFSEYLLEPKNTQSIDDEENMDVINSNYLYFSFGTVMKVLINVDGYYISRPVAKGVQHCSPNTTKLYCRAQCRIELIENLFNCSPTYWATMIQPTSGLDECTFDRYMECMNFNANDDFHCKNACLPSCTARYSRMDYTEQDLSYNYSDIVVVRISVKNGIYASIEELPIFKFHELMFTVLLDTLLRHKIKELTICLISMGRILQKVSQIFLLTNFFA